MVTIQYHNKLLLVVKVDQKIFVKKRMIKKKEKKKEHLSGYKVGGERERKGVR